MNQTENINELVAALSKAQGNMRPAVYNKLNPHFKNRYADLASCMDACREPLAQNGLSVMQYVEKQGETFCLVTMLAHASGQWMKSYLPMQTEKKTCQALGAEMTYLKRYGISAMLGIVSDEEQEAEDDGERAMPPRKQESVNSIVNIPAPSRINSNQIIELNNLLEPCDEDYKSKFFELLDKKYGKKSLAVIPVTDFENIKRYIESALKIKNEAVVDV
jgi:hypothetical protein